MSYSVMLKEELVQEECKDREIVPFLNGFLSLSIFKEGCIRLRTQAIRDGILKVLEEAGIEVKDCKENMLRLYDLSEEFLHAPYRFIAHEHDTRAYLRGVFLARGNITSPEKAYHLEFSLPEKDIRRLVEDYLEKFGIHMSYTKRGNERILYNKNSNEIIDFLHLIGLRKQAFAYEELKVVRQLKNDVMRRTNCEVGNLERIARSSSQQIECIEYLIEKIGLSNLDSDLVEVMQIRLDYPEASLQQIADRMSVPMSKSGIRHRFNRILKLCEKIKEEQ